jgi:thiamine-phosphate pyrophosphorylase
MSSDPLFSGSIGSLRGLYGIVSPTAGGQAARQAQALALTQAFVEGGAPVVQLRDKEADARTLLETARAIRALTRAAGVRFVLNDRLDLALLADADGVHVGQDDLAVGDVRAVLAALGRRSPFLVGLSTHDLAQVRAGVAAGADYLGFGPIHPTASKRDALPARGCAQLKEAVLAAGAVPVVAIGGVSRANAHEITAAGAAMGAVISDVALAADPRAAAAALHRALSGE